MCTPVPSYVVPLYPHVHTPVFTYRDMGAYPHPRACPEEDPGKHRGEVLGLLTSGPAYP